MDRSRRERKRRTNLLIRVRALHLGEHNILNTVLISQRNQLTDLLFNQGLISLQCRGAIATIPIRAEAVEFVMAGCRSEELGHPVDALVDARLVLQGDTADATCAGLNAVAGAGGADFGSYGVLSVSEIVDAALRWECQLVGLLGVRFEGRTQLSTAC